MRDSFPDNAPENRNCRLIPAGIMMLIFSMLIPWPSYSQPASIRIDSVSVTPDNYVVIGWTLLTDATGGYVGVYKRNETETYDLLIRVPLHQTFYLDAAAHAGITAESYYVVLYDAQENIVGNPANDAHQTIFFKTLTPDICSRRIGAAWDNYALSTTVGTPVSLPSPFVRNQLLVAYNNGDYRVVSESAHDTQSGGISFAASGRYCFFIRSVQQDPSITSSSNIRCIDVKIPAQPAYVYIKAVTVDEVSGKVRLSVHTDQSVPRPAWQIERFSHQLNDFEMIHQTEQTGSIIEFTDLASDPSRKAESYRIVALDSCRHETILSQTVSSIHLTAFKRSPDVNELSWTAYSGWPAGVREYVIQRKQGADGIFENIAAVAEGTESFTDDLALQNINRLQSDIFYRLVAEERAGNPFGFQERAFSNIAMVETDFEVFIPNAFKPGSEIAANRVFKPVFPYLQPQKYSIRIFNRWGQDVFAAADIAEAWDGNHNGKALPAGVYAYVIAYEDDGGKKYEKRGSVLLMR
jgi:gliding motility-associated-like protein